MRRIPDFDDIPWEWIVIGTCIGSAVVVAVLVILG